MAEDPYRIEILCGYGGLVLIARLVRFGLKVLGMQTRPNPVVHLILAIVRYAELKGL